MNYGWGRLAPDSDRAASAAMTCESDELREAECSVGPTGRSRCLHLLVRGSPPSAEPLPDTSVRDPARPSSAKDTSSSTLILGS